MARLILAVLAGYATTFVVVMGTFTVAYLAMGAGRAFEPGTYEVTPLWLATSFGLGFIAAILGGVVAVSIGRHTKAAKALAAAVVVLGLLLAIPSLTSPRQPGARDGAVPNFEAMRKAQQPSWVSLLNPFVGAVGVMVGSRLRRVSAGGTPSSVQ